MSKIWNYEIHKVLPSPSKLAAKFMPNLDHLKKDLNDPEFQKRMKHMKTKQQEYMMTLLRKRGQLIELEGGGTRIIASPNLTSVFIPIALKNKPIELWTRSEQIWLNM